MKTRTCRTHLAGSVEVAVLPQRRDGVRAVEAGRQVVLVPVATAAGAGGGGVLVLHGAADPARLVRPYQR